MCLGQQSSLTTEGSHQFYCVSLLQTPHQSPTATPRTRGLPPRPPSPFPQDRKSSILSTASQKYGYLPGRLRMEQGTPLCSAFLRLPQVLTVASGTLGTVIQHDECGLGSLEHQELPMLLLFLGPGADSDSVSRRAWDWLPSKFFWYNDHTKRKALLQCEPSDVSKQSVLSRPEASREVGKLSWPSCSASKRSAPLNQSLGIFLHVYNRACKLPTFPPKLERQRT